MLILLNSKINKNKILNILPVQKGLIIMETQDTLCRNIIRIAQAEERSLEIPCLELNCTWSELQQKIVNREPEAISTCANWLSRSVDSILSY